MAAEIGELNDEDKLPGPPVRPSCRAKPEWRPGQLHPLARLFGSRLYEASPTPKSNLRGSPILCPQV